MKLSMKHSAMALVAMCVIGCVTPDPSARDSAKDANASGDPVALSVEAQTAAEGRKPIIPMPSAPLDRTAAITRIAFGSCLKQEDDQSIWHSIRATDPDVFLFIGDNVYGDVYSGDANMPELRAAYRKLARSRPFKRLRTDVPVLATWDDHDFGLNDAGGDYPFKYESEKIFEEAWALPKDDPRRTRDGIYHSEIIGPPGQRVQIIMLDTRFFRDPLTPTDERGAPGKERYLPDEDPTKTMLGEAQYEWLLDELSKPADLRIVVSSIQVIADGHGWEAWRTLPTERQKLYDTIAGPGAERVLLLSGDRHSGALYRDDSALTYPLFELTSSSLNAPSSKWRAQSGETRVEDGPNRLGSMYFDVNFGVVDIDWAGETIRMGLRDADGNALPQTIRIPFAAIEYRD